MPKLRQILITLVAVIIAGAAAGLGGGGWYLSNILKKDALTPDHAESELDMQVLAIDGGEITLEVTPLTGNPGAWDHEGVWGVRWNGGYGQIGPIIQLTDTDVVRPFTVFFGELRPGDHVRLEGMAFPENPLVAFGIPFQQVQYQSDLGAFNAWYVEGARDTWVVFVHGRNVTPKEGLRILPTLVELGYPVLMITYRNDEGMPANPDGLLRYGQAEWQDVEGAVQYALDQGADDVVVAGFSMGGATVVNFLYQSALADNVQGVILDAPMMNFNKTIDLGVEQRGYPIIVAAIAKAFGQMRFGVDWGALDYLKKADQLKSPVLLFHGDVDQTVPVSTSDILAAARPDLVTYVRVPGALHVGSWNRDSQRYEAAVRDFLEGLESG